MRIYDYAPRLALRAHVRRRRSLIGTLLLLALPALSLQSLPSTATTVGITTDIAQR